jgi:hypothetical protein
MGWNLATTEILFENKVIRLYRFQRASNPCVTPESNALESSHLRALALISQLFMDDQYPLSKILTIPSGIHIQHANPI